VLPAPCRPAAGCLIQQQAELCGGTASGKPEASGIPCGRELGQAVRESAAAQNQQRYTQTTGPLQSVEHESEAFGALLDQLHLTRAKCA